MSLYELYQADSVFHGYVDRYCHNYNEGRGITVEEALTHKLVRAYAGERDSFVLDNPE